MRRKERERERERERREKEKGRESKNERMLVCQTRLLAPANTIH